MAFWHFSECIRIARARINIFNVPKKMLRAEIHFPAMVSNINRLPENMNNVGMAKYAILYLPTFSAEKSFDVARRNVAVPHH